MLWNYIYMLLTNFATMFLIPWQLRIFQNIHHCQHGNCRILANGTRIWHLECRYHLTSIWAEDLDPITLGIASEHVYTTFFWTPTSHTLWQLSEEALFGHFVLALNAAFTQQLSLVDEGYMSGSNNDLPTPLQKHHAYTTFPAWNMHLSIQPTPCHAAQLTCHTTTHN